MSKFKITILIFFYLINSAIAKTVENKKFTYTVFIGRFQPFHDGHLKVVESALQVSEKIIILCGSANKPRSFKNPLTFSERKELISKVLEDNYNNRYFIEALDDYESDDDWRNSVLNSVKKIAGKGKTRVALIGHQKDASSYYLSLFPEWRYLEVENYQGINATDIRKLISQNKIDEVKHFLPPQAHEFIPLIKKYVGEFN
ncbi:MAG: adenylyltransferase/cytidyltransferase family protein [Sphingobacteriia bacterium]|nr:adenylyltransferase/cytidyltransferase family protein [Sphingobacteriia bacterium]